ncbi:hypothetical protein SAMN05192564_106268 [Paraburkholderia sartisoli]|uniref:Uncharacterized protein n=1 Tax=Paraburkholderia sartisoli TaxID=83784 RepID=A0A1H4GT89_9BURK|nr:hypothetical protein SAMN05192564_106268 [Paraburkholderia sartisoli]
MLLDSIKDIRRRPSWIGSSEYWPRQKWSVIYSKICDVLREGVAVKYDVIEQMRQRYPMAPMCRFLGVSISGYYAW